MQPQPQVPTAPTASVDYKAIANDFLHGTGSRLTEAQKNLFAKICQTFNLNPFKREVYAVGFKDRFAVITGYEVYLKRAEASGKLDGWETEVQGTGENMTAEVTIWRKDWSRPMKHKIFAKEFLKEGGMWKTMPRYMLEKVAISQAFRRAFPEDLGGMPYTKEEMDSNDVIDVKGEERANELANESVEVISVEKIAELFQAASINQLKTKWQKLNKLEKTKIKRDQKLNAQFEKIKASLPQIAPKPAQLIELLECSDLRDFEELTQKLPDDVKKLISEDEALRDEYEAVALELAPGSEADLY